MAQLDICRLRTAAGLFLDCQSDAMASLDTRLMAPLMPPGTVPRTFSARLNPRFVIEGSTYLLVPQFAAAVRREEILTSIGALPQDTRERVIAAFDVLLTGV